MKHLNKAALSYNLFCFFFKPYQNFHLAWLLCDLLALWLWKPDFLKLQWTLKERAIISQVTWAKSFDDLRWNQSMLKCEALFKAINTILRSSYVESRVRTNMRWEFIQMKSRSIYTRIPQKLFIAPMEFTLGIVQFASYFSWSEPRLAMQISTFKKSFKFTPSDPGSTWCDIIAYWLHNLYQIPVFFCLYPKRFFFFVLLLQHLNYSHTWDVRCSRTSFA